MPLNMAKQLYKQKFQDIGYYLCGQRNVIYYQFIIYSFKANYK